MTAIVVKGEDTVQKAFAQLRNGAQDLTPQQQQIGAYIANAARANVPKRSGYLMSTISSSGRAGEASVRAGARYGGVIEWGWRARGIRRRAYIARAVMGSQERIRQLYVEGLTALCKRVQAGGAE